MDDIERNLCERQSFKAVNDVLTGVTLHDKQSIDVIKSLYSKKSLIMYPTGTGKTFMCSAIMAMLLREDPSRKFIMFVKKDQLIQTPFDVEMLTRRRVLATAANAKSLKNTIYKEDVDKFSVLMLTHECLLNRQLLGELYEIKNSYCGVIIDEAHELNNTTKAESGEMLEAFVRNFEYVIALTATPVISDFVQIARLANLVDHKRYSNPKQLKRQLLNRQFDIKEDPCFFITRTPEEFGRVTKPKGFMVTVDPLAHQSRSGKGGVELMQLNRGEGSTKQANALVDFVKEQSATDKRGLIFVSQHSVREYLLPFFDRADIMYDCVNSETKFQERVTVMEKFNVQKSLDVVITSVTTSLNLDCDYVFFYEFTSDIKQMIGRAHRGLYDKQLYVYWLITMCEEELRYFKENIYDRSLEIQEILGIDYNEVITANDHLGNRG